MIVEELDPEVTDKGGPERALNIGCRIHSLTGAELLVDSRVIENFLLNLRVVPKLSSSSHASWDRGHAARSTRAIMNRLSASKVHVFASEPKQASTFLGRQIV